MDRTADYQWTPRTNRSDNSPSQRNTPPVAQRINGQVSSSEQVEHSNHQAACPECSGTDISTEDKVQFCEDCGCILTEKQLERSEPSWLDETDRRLGPRQSTLWINTGSSISSGDSGPVGRLRQYDERLTNAERSLVTGLREVRTLSSALELPQSTRGRAAHLYRQAAQENLLKGRTIDGIAAACVYIAGRERGSPVTIARVSDVSPMDEGKIRHCTGILQSELSLSIPPARPREFLPMISSGLSLPEAVSKRGADILEKCTSEGLHVGKHPAAMAATAIYAAAVQRGVELSQQEAANAADVSSVTISRRYQDIQDIL